MSDCLLGIPKINLRSSPTRVRIGVMLQEAGSRVWFNLWRYVRGHRSGERNAGNPRLARTGSVRLRGENLCCFGFVVVSMIRACVLNLRRRLESLVWFWLLDEWFGGIWNVGFLNVAFKSSRRSVIENVPPFRYLNSGGGIENVSPWKIELLIESQSFRLSHVYFNCSVFHHWMTYCFIVVEILAVNQCISN